MFKTRFYLSRSTVCSSFIWSVTLSLIRLLPKSIPSVSGWCELINRSGSISTKISTQMKTRSATRRTTSWKKPGGRRCEHLSENSSQFHKWSFEILLQIGRITYKHATSNVVAWSLLDLSTQESEKIWLKKERQEKYEQSKDAICRCCHGGDFAAARPLQSKKFSIMSLFKSRLLLF